jgi:hypothetical protein
MFYDVLFEMQSNRIEAKRDKKSQQSNNGSNKHGYNALHGTKRRVWFDIP